MKGRQERETKRGREGNKESEGDKERERQGGREAGVGGGGGDRPVDRGGCRDRSAGCSTGLRCHSDTADRSVASTSVCPTETSPRTASASPSLAPSAQLIKTNCLIKKRKK